MTGMGMGRTKRMMGMGIVIDGFGAASVAGAGASRRVTEANAFELLEVGLGGVSAGG